MWAYLALVCLLEVFNPISGVGLGQCHGAACVDIDRDGLYDVVVASDIGVDYYRNLGETTFSLRRLASIAANAVVAGDLANDDGYVDLFVAAPGRDFLLVNTGDDMNFDYNDSFFASDTSRAAALVDFDADGDLDIFVAGDTSRLYRNDQNSFSMIQTFPMGFAVSWADYNSDGRPDFALAAEDSVLFYASPGFTLDTAIGAVAPRGLCWLDCNADNMLDLAVADSAGPNLLIKRTTSGFVSQEIDTVNAPSVAVAAGHFWGEPGADLLFINHGTADHLFRGSLNGEFSTSPDDTVSFENNNQGRAVALADLDRKNGIDAVVVGSPVNAIYLSDVTSINKVTVNLKGRRDLAASLSNTMAAGALLRLYENGDLCGFWEIQAGSGHAGQDAPQKILPLPTTTGHLLTIQWPRSGVIDSIPLDTFTLPVLIDACEDITPPLPPESLRCTSHDPLAWSNQSRVGFEWNAAQDPHGSGIAGYSVLWSKDTLAYPDDEVETSDTLMTDSTDLEGDSCFFFISSVDSVGNVSAPLRYAPLKLDFHPPDSIELIHPSAYSYLNDTFVRYEWSAGVDTLSGIASYSMEVSNRHDFLGRKADSLLDTRDTFYQSAANLGEMWHYWRLTVKDAAGNTNTIPSQQNDTLGIPFNVDVTAPVVIMRGVIPQPGATAATNTNIIVQFSEPMLPGLARADTNYILQQNNMDVPFTVDSLDTYRFMLDPTTLLEPENDYTYVKVRQRITDLAGNRLAADTFFWSFRTGKAPDLEGPVIDLVVIDPNPTGGRKTVNIQARATDEHHGGGVPIRCVFFIDDSPDTNEMQLADGTYNSPVELYTFDLDVDTFEDNSYLLFFKAMDGSQNWGGVKIDTLDVSDDITPPKLTIDVLNDTTRLYIGDTLSLEITSNEPLRQLYILFSQITEEDSFYRQHSVPITDSPDSKFFKLKVHLSGFPKGPIQATVRGEDMAGNSTTLSFGFRLSSRDLLPPDKAFAAPNPASDDVGIYFTPGEKVQASLRVFTIDGHEVWNPDPVEEAQGGERSVFTADVSRWPVGLYIFVLQATNDQGQKAKVKKVFAVVR
jgi:hypothetical protein